MTGPWRQRCPFGHASVSTNHNETSYRCDACGLVFEGHPVDAKSVDEFPVDDFEIKIQQMDLDQILSTLVELHQGRDLTWISSKRLAQDLAGSRKGIGKKLTTLEESGLVECWRSETVRSRWRPTAAGLDAVADEGDLEKRAVA